jgi:hypothetical protein
MIRLPTTTLILALTGSLAFAQAWPTQNGRRLDVNPQIGSGGVNSIRNVDPYAGQIGNLYITGQVTGGAFFRGRVPYGRLDELRLNLPSEAMDSFNRDSIGLQGALSGRAFGPPLPYFSPTGTVYTAQDALAGRAGPVTGVVQSAAHAPEEGQPPLTPGTMVLTPAGVASPGTPMLPVNLETLATTSIPSAVGLPGEYAVRPLVSGLFGVLRTGEGDRIAKQVAARVAGEAEATPEQPSQAAPTAADVETPVQPKPPSAAPGTPQADDAAMPDLSKLPDLGPSSQEDLFAQIVHLMRQGEQEQPATIESPVSGEKGPANPNRLDEDPSARIAAQRQAPSVLAGSVGKQLVLHGLAGRRNDAFNRFMSLGDDELRHGRFYQAASQYEGAQTVNPSNPLSAVGAGLAYLGAGEAYRAGMYLQRAMRLFPPMAQVRIDVDRILGKDAADARLAQLEGRVATEAEKADTQLLFLITWVKASRGQTKEAIAWAQKLQPLLTDEDATLKAYVKDVIAAGRPTTTAPAAAPATAH